MASAMNGIALHGGLIPYGGTFLTFSDYARPAMRLASLMHIRSIFVMTHDSIGLGEDGPTHQPIEHLASLRMIPGLSVWRPCDTVETAVAWKAAVERRDGPTVLALTRQNLPHQQRDDAQVKNIARGGYVLRDAG
jgi:transketolase